MKKKVFGALLAAVILCFGTASVFAVDKNLIYTDMQIYTARIYVCDTEKNRAVLVNVAPLKNPYSLNQASHIEYKALPINTDMIIGSKGQKLSMEVVNGYLLDKTVTVLVGSCGYGYRIAYMGFED